MSSDEVYIANKILISLLVFSTMYYVNTIYLEYKVIPLEVFHAKLIPVPPHQ